MGVELVRTTTSDGLRLDGAFQLAETEPSIDLDAVILLHGVGGSFYGGSLFDTIIESLLAVGVSPLRVNTRGHGTVSVIPTTGGPTRQGCAYEVVDHCRYDIGAWIKFLQDRELTRVGLLGHSLGAIKALYAAAHEPDIDARCVIAASPPRLSFSVFQNAIDNSAFLESMATAKLHVRDGKPEQLFNARFPYPLLISAASYVDKYGPGERYNILRFIDQVRQPTLLTYGQLELESGGVAFTGLPEAIHAATEEAQRIQTVTIDQADHFYTGAADRLGKAIMSWMTHELPRRFT